MTIYRKKTFGNASLRAFAMAFLALLSALAGAEPIAFVDVTVVSVDHGKLTPGQTVLIRDGRIVAVGSTGALAIPVGAQRVDGRNRYLCPGLADMHVHFSRAPVPGKEIEWGTLNHREKNRLYAFLYIANGVTTVREMWGNPQSDQLASDIYAGKLPGPTLYSTGPVTDGDPPAWKEARTVTNAADAEAAVRADKARGYVGIKVYDNLTPPQYHAIVDAAKAGRFPVMGHVPLAVPLEDVIAARQKSIEHSDSFLSDISPAPWAAAAKMPSRALYTAGIDPGKLASFSRALQQADIWVCPTIAVNQMEWPEGRIGAGMQYVPPRYFAKLRENYASADYPEAAIETAYALQLVQGLHAAGVRLLPGTDAARPNVVPGFSLHDELRYFVNAGMTAPQALKAATSEPAAFLGLEKEFGTVEVGKRADLLLLDANPLEDVSNLRRRAGVMVRGEWFDTDRIERHLQKLAKAAKK